MTVPVPRRLPDASSTAIRPAKLGHVVLRVYNLARSRDWYFNVLEAHPTFENEMICFLTYDDEHHRFAFANLDVLKPGGKSADERGEIGVNHVAYTYGSVGDLLDTYARLKRAGIKPYWPVHHGTTLSLYYTDPDGNRLELQHDVFERAQDLDGFFASGAYTENFIGVIFDPELMIARFEAGEPLEAITARPKLPADKTPWDMVIP